MKAVFGSVEDIKLREPFSLIKDKSCPHAHAKLSWQSQSSLDDTMPLGTQAVSQCLPCLLVSFLCFI